MLTAKLDVTKIDKSKIFAGKKGKYIDIVLIENKHGTDEFGNSGFVAQSTTKEEKAAGKRGAILGNYKVIGRRSGPPQTQVSTESDEAGDSSDVPY